MKEQGHHLSLPFSHSPGGECCGSLWSQLTELDVLGVQKKAQASRRGIAHWSPSDCIYFANASPLRNYVISSTFLQLMKFKKKCSVGCSSKFSIHSLFPNMTKTWKSMFTCIMICCVFLRITYIEQIYYYNYLLNYFSSSLSVPLWYLVFIVDSG